LARWSLGSGGGRIEARTFLSGMLLGAHGTVIRGRLDESFVDRRTGGLGAPGEDNPLGWPHEPGHRRNAFRLGHSYFGIRSFSLVLAQWWQRTQASMLAPSLWTFFVPPIPFAATQSTSIEAEIGIKIIAAVHSQCRCWVRSVRFTMSAQCPLLLARPPRTTKVLAARFWRTPAITYSTCQRVAYLLNI
jgi:hypothetical protein